jgi:hypothetical protein
LTANLTSTSIQLLAAIDNLGHTLIIAVEEILLAIALGDTLGLETLREGVGTAGGTVGVGKWRVTLQATVAVIPDATVQKNVVLVRVYVFVGRVPADVRICRVKTEA